jgi:hypothetical protein
MRPAFFGVFIAVGYFFTTSVLANFEETFEGALGKEWLTEVNQFNSWQPACEAQQSLKGACGYKSGTATSALQLSLSNGATGTLSFQAAVSTDGEFYVFVDGVKVVSQTGTLDWGLHQYVIPAGIHTVQFFHQGAGSVTIDALSFYEDLDIPLRVIQDPYANVVWGSSYRMKTQLHDHAHNEWNGQEQKYLDDYDAAGYSVISYMNYSGIESATFTWKEKRWPVEDWFPASVLDGLQNIKFFIPNGEEAGFGNMHITSPFLVDYISFWEGGSYMPLNYSTKQGLIDQIVNRGGLAFIAHPFSASDGFPIVNGYTGAEIYNAYYGYRNLVVGDMNRNPDLLASWDQMLLQDSSVIGIATNDHIGPWTGHDMRVRDSGKIIVLSSSENMIDFRAALEGGAVFAVKDQGSLAKDTYPTISAIDVGADEVSISTNGQVTWVANGAPVSSGATLPYDLLPAGTRYIRAEVSDAESTVYTQAFGMTSAQPQIIDIDIDPFSSANIVKPSSDNPIFLTLMGSSTFDVTQVDPESLRLGMGQWHPGYPLLNNMDGDPGKHIDATYIFKTEVTGIACDDTRATLTGSTYGGVLFAGTDSIDTTDCDAAGSCHP